MRSSSRASASGFGFGTDADADMTTDFGFGSAGTTTMQQRRAMSMRWGADSQMDDATATASPLIDEFRAEFESHHSLAAQARAERARAQQFNETRSSATTAGLGMHMQSQRGGVGVALDAPPTSSLSAMLAATQPLRSDAAGASFAGGLSARDFPSRSGGGAQRGGASPSPSLDVHRAHANFQQLMGAQHQFAYKEWAASVLHWRTVAAAVWFGAATLAALHIASLRYTSSAPGWRTLGWGWDLQWEAPLLAHWPATVAFLGAQVALLVMRAQAAHTDPSALFQPLALRVWRCLTQPRLVLLASSAAMAVLIAGWNAAYVLFAESRLWNGAAAPAAAAAAGAATSSDLSLVIAGLLCYTLVQSFLLVFQCEQLLQFPLLRFQSRTRQLLAVVPGLFLRAAGFALAFCAAFRVAVWSSIRYALTALAQAASGVEDPAAAASASAAAAPSSLFSFSSLPALYHLFVLVLLLHFCALLARAFLSVFLTQPLDFGPFVLHALYDTRSGADAAAASDDPSAAERRVDEWRSSAGDAAGQGFCSPLLAASAPRGSDHLTGHLVLHYLRTLATEAALVPQRNAVLFGDMNALVSGAGGDGGAAAAQGILLQPQGQSAGVPQSLRSTLPHQATFVPVLLSCLHRVRMLTEALVAQRALTSYAPPADDWHAAAAVQSGGSGSSSGSSGFGSVAALSPFNSAPRTVASAAFVSTQLDGAGLVFPSKAQLTAQVFAHAKQAEMAVDILAGLAVHAQAETAAAAAAGIHPAAAAGLYASSPAGGAAQLSGEWAETIVSHLVALSLALEQYAHAAHFLSPIQDRALQGHQLTRAVCVQLAANVDNALYRLTASYFDVLADFHLAPAYAARLQAYANFAK